MKKPYALLLAFVMLMAGVTSTALWFRSRQARPAPTAVETTTKMNEVVQSIKREEKVVLLSLGVQGITERSVTRKVWGKDVPGTRRTMFIQHNYRALLGVDGKGVTLTQTGPKTVRVDIPEFLFIGYNDVSFKTAVEKNGVLSWGTPEIDTTNLITEILNSQAKQQHVRDNREPLEEQARAFYGGIIKGVDPSITPTFRFATSS